MGVPPRSPDDFDGAPLNEHNTGALDSTLYAILKDLRKTVAKGDMPEVNWGMPVTSLKAAYSLDPAWGMGEEFEKNNLFGVAGRR